MTLQPNSAQMVADFKGPGVKFQGILHGPKFNVIDSTTLVPLGNGRLRQTIEWAKEDGTKRKIVFDAVYAPKSGP